MIKTRVTTRGVISELATDGIAEFILEVPSDISGSVGVIELGELEDVDTTGVADGNALIYNESLQQWVPGQGGGASTVSDLTDVNLIGLQDGFVLLWDENAGQWVPDVPTAITGGLAAVATSGDYADLIGTQSPSTVVNDSEFTNNNIAVFRRWDGVLDFVGSSTNNSGTVAQFSMGEHDGLFLQSSVDVNGNSGSFEGQLSQILIESDDPDTIAIIKGNTFRTAVGGSGQTEKVGDADSEQGDLVGLSSELNIFGSTEFGDAKATRTVLDITDASSGSLAIGNEIRINGAANAVVKSPVCIQNNIDYNNTATDIAIEQVSIINSDINVYSASYAPIINTVGDVDHADNIQVYTSFINVITASQSYQDFTANPNIGYVEDYSGINLSPNIDYAANSAAVIRCNAENISGNPGAPSTATLGDVFMQTVEAEGGGPNIQFIDGATAGNESFFFDENTSTIVIVIEAGVSTAQQIVDLINFEIGFFLDASVTGTGNEPQGEEGPVPITGGVSPTAVRAGYFNGEVEINGDLIVNGEFDFERSSLNIFNEIELENTAGEPLISNLIGTDFIADDNDTVTGDYIATLSINSLDLGENITVNNGTFGVGISAHAALSDISIGNSTEIDSIFCTNNIALLNAEGGGGGKVTNLVGSNVMFLPIDDGDTEVENSYAFRFSADMGLVAENNWGVYIAGEDVNNYMEGNLQVEGAIIIGEDAETDNDSIGIEIKGVNKAFLNARMDTDERDALSAVNGMLIYNTDTNKLQVRANGVWEDLH